MTKSGDCFYDTQAASLEAKPYPTLDAIQNVFALALKRDPEIKNFNPLALWDLHYLREIDDSAYINRLTVNALDYNSLAKRGDHSGDVPRRHIGAENSPAYTLRIGNSLLRLRNRSSREALPNQIFTLTLPYLRKTFSSTLDSKSNHYTRAIVLRPEPLFYTGNT